MKAQQQPQIHVNVSNVNENRNTNGYGGAYPSKHRWVAFFLCLFLGFLGIHRFYVGKGGTGFIWLITGGLVGIGWVVDLLLILFNCFRDKNGHAAGVKI